MKRQTRIVGNWLSEHNKNRYGDTETGIKDCNRVRDNARPHLPKGRCDLLDVQKLIWIKPDVEGDEISKSLMKDELA